MNIGSESYKKYADAHAPKSRVLYNSAMAFLIGGLICASAEAMNHLWEALGMTQEDGGLLTSVVLVFAAAVLTAAGIFDNIAKVAGITLARELWGIFADTPAFFSQLVDRCLAVCRPQLPHADLDIILVPEHSPQ
mgnify:CR=1 FL=1